MFIRQRMTINIIFILSFSLLLVACGPKPTPNPTTSKISGVASLDLINGGAVTVYALDDSGAKGKVLGTATTKSDGSYSVDIGTYTGNVIVEVAGGTYTDEATGEAKTNGTLRAALPEVTGNVSVAVTPMTEIAVLNAGTLTKDNINKANSLASSVAGVDIIKTMPANVTSSDSATASVDEQTYGLMLASISQMIKDGNAAGVSEAIGAIKDDLSDDNQLNSTGGKLMSALGAFIDPANTKNKTNLHTLNETKLDDAITYIKDNPITPVADTPNLNKAKALIADLRNTVLSIYNYQGAGTPGIVETPFNNLADELKTKIEPDLTDVVDRIGWIIESNNTVAKGATGTFSRGSNTLTITQGETTDSFKVTDTTGATIDSGILTLNSDPAVTDPTSGTFEANMKTASGTLTVNLNYTGIISSGQYTSMTFTGSITAPDFSLDFSEGGRKLYATFAVRPDSPEEIYPTSVLLAARITTSTAKMDGSLDISTVWQSNNYDGWGNSCYGDVVPKTGTFDGSFQELKDGAPTGVKFSGTITGKWDNADTYNGCTGDSSKNFTKWSASFDGTIEAPSRPKIVTFLKITQSAYNEVKVDVSYTETKTDGTVASLSGSGTINDGILDASLTNQDGMKVNISFDDSKSKDKRFTGTIETSGGTKEADLYTVNNVPKVKYIDNFFESIL